MHDGPRADAPNFRDEVINRPPSHSAVVELSPPPCLVKGSNVSVAMDMVGDGYLGVRERRYYEADVKLVGRVGLWSECDGLRGGRRRVLGRRDGSADS